MTLAVAWLCWLGEENSATWNLLLAVDCGKFLPFVRRRSVVDDVSAGIPKVFARVCRNLIILQTQIVPRSQLLYTSASFHVSAVGKIDYARRGKRRCCAVRGIANASRMRFMQWKAQKYMEFRLYF
jgi:hypothetical protein